MPRLNIRYHFAICVHLLTKQCGHRLNDLLLGPIASVARRNFLKRKRGFMVSNMMQAMPGKEPAEYDRIIRRSVDLMWQILLRQLSRKDKQAHPREIINESAIDAIVSGIPKGAIVITSHQGDWEDLIQYFRERDDLDTCNLYRKPKCEKMAGFLRKFRGVDQYCSGYGLIKRFANAGSQKVFALIGVDQTPLKKGISVDFLNRPTQISPICVQIALRFRLPVVIAKTLVQNGKTIISFREIDISNTDNSSKEDTEHFALQRVMDEIAQDIVEDPDQWLMWSHNFWKPVRKPPPPMQEYFPRRVSSVSEKETSLNV